MTLESNLLLYLFQCNNGVDIYMIMITTIYFEKLWSLGVLQLPSTVQDLIHNIIQSINQKLMIFEWCAEKILCFDSFPAKIRDIWNLLSVNNKHEYWPKSNAIMKFWSKRLWNSGWAMNNPQLIAKKINIERFINIENWFGLTNNYKITPTFFVRCIASLNIRHL